MIIEARPAGLSDVGAVQTLSDEPSCVEGIAEFDAAALRAIIDGDEQDLIVGTIDGLTVGYAVTRVERRRLADAGRRSVGVIEAMYVEEGARGVGVGEAMLRHAVALLEARGAGFLDAAVRPGNRLGKRFFEGHGFKARSIVMHRAGMARAEEDR